MRVKFSNHLKGNLKHPPNKWRKIDWKLAATLLALEPKRESVADFMFIGEIEKLRKRINEYSKVETGKRRGRKEKTTLEDDRIFMDFCEHRRNALAAELDKPSSKVSDRAVARSLYDEFGHQIPDRNWVTNSSKLEYLVNRIKYLKKKLKMGNK